MGQGPVAGKILGTNLGTYGALSVSGVGITAATPTNWTPTEIDLTFNFDNSVLPGSYPVTVDTTSYGGSDATYLAQAGVAQEGGRSSANMAVSSTCKPVINGVGVNGSTSPYLIAGASGYFSIYGVTSNCVNSVKVDGTEVEIKNFQIYTIGIGCSQHGPPHPG